MNPNQQPHLEHPEQPLNQLPPHPPTMINVESVPQSTEVLPTVAPESTGTHDYAHPIPDKPKKSFNSKRLIIALGVFVAVSLLAVAAMLVFALLPANTTKNTVTPTKQTDTKADASVSAKLAIEHVKEYFKGDKTAKSPLTLPVQATGQPFYTVIPDIAPLVSVAGNVAPDKSAAQLYSIEHSLEGDGFTRLANKGGPETVNYLADFTLPNTFCEVAVTKPADAKADHWFEVRCLDMSEYSSYAAAQNPLVELYTPLSATSVLYGFVGKPAPVASKTTGYKTAQLQVSIIIDSHTTSTGKFALYYQTPDGLWHYFRDSDTTQAFDCDEYKADDLKNAYLGTPCRNTSKGTMQVVEAPKKKS